MASMRWYSIVVVDVVIVDGKSTLVVAAVELIFRSTIIFFVGGDCDATCSMEYDANG